MAFRFSSPIARATGASALLHAVGLAAILVPIERTPREPAPAGPTVELRLIETQGAERAVHAPQPAQPPHLSPNALPQGEGASAPRLPLPLREEAGRRDQASPPQVNLAGDSTANVLASGPAVLPARIDARWRNREPVYPPAAAQNREAGAVLLLIHVGADGAVMSIDLAESSGFPRLDGEARTAVETWHFLPAVQDGQPVASDMPLRIVFQLN